MHIETTDRLSRRRILPYRLPGIEQLQKNKVNWPIVGRDCALLIHDMQNFWLSFFEDTSVLIDNIVTLRNLARQLGMPVIYSEAERPRSLAERALGLEMWGPGIGAQHLTDSDRSVVAQLTPSVDDYIVHKPRYSAFFRTELENILQKTNRRQLLVTGVFAHHGVLLSAADAYMRNIKVSVVVDATADYSIKDHVSALDFVAEVCGTLVTTDAAREQLLASPTPQTFSNSVGARN